MASAYRFLTVSPHIQNQHHLIWRIKAPPRVLTFTWLMLNNKILTVNNLVKRGMQIPNMCHLCRSHQESVTRIFQKCPFSINLRNYVLQTMHSASSDLYQTAQTKQLLLGHQHDRFWQRMEICSIFVIWRQRCRRIFTGKSQDIVQTTREIFSEMRNWFGQQRSTDTGTTQRLQCTPPLFSLCILFRNLFIFYFHFTL
jgi:zinc-binding in reverse transcriptase